MHRSHLRLVLLAGLTLLASCASQRELLRPLPANTTIVLVRHAEKHPVTKQLTAIGHANARALPEAVADLDIAAIYSPDIPRNLDTVRPLADQRGLKVTVLPVVEEGFKPEQVTRRLLTDHPGRTVLWVGNVWNLEQIYPALGGTGRPPIYYGELYVLKNSAAGKPVVETRSF